MDEQNQKAQPKAKPVHGIIIGAKRVNLRVEGLVNARIVGTVDQYEEVLVDKTKTTKDYIYVTPNSGFPGYVAKRFLAIKMV